MSSYNTTAKEQEKAAAIRGHYLNKENSKWEQLRTLNNKVRKPAIIVSTIIAMIGVLVMGAGMAEIMVYGNMSTGLALSIPGLIVALISILVYKIILNKRKEKYSNQILQLSSEITGK